MIGGKRRHGLFHSVFDIHQDKVAGLPGAAAVGVVRGVAGFDVLRGVCAAGIALGVPLPRDLGGKRAGVTGGYFCGVAAGAGCSAAIAFAAVGGRAPDAPVFAVAGLAHSLGGDYRLAGVAVAVRIGARIGAAAGCLRSAADQGVRERDDVVNLSHAQ